VSERERGTCPECGNTDVQLTRAGLLYKHPAGDGVTCPGSGGEPAAQAGLDGDWPGGDDAGFREVGRPVVLAPEIPPMYSWRLTVRQPALYLNDPAWHAANAQAAACAARAAGHKPAGEAQCTAVAATEDGMGLSLTYTLLIEGDPRG